MDKYEFNIKVEQMKKLVNKGDYETAMKIADTIDWRRVRNANLLSLVSSVYEKNHEYHEAKEILLIAFERAPIGKRLLYKLTQLALKEGEIAEAEAYYREFCMMAEDDSRQYILRYLILRAKNAAPQQLIHALENYTSLELDEKWLYQLAELYSEAGMEEECVRTCDKIMLMFGLGQYVDKAMELKIQYAPLTRYQMDLVENRDKYEEKLRAVEQGNYVVEEPAYSGQENYDYSQDAGYAGEPEYEAGYTQERYEPERGYEDQAGYAEGGYAQEAYPEAQYQDDGYYGQEEAYAQEDAYGAEDSGYGGEEAWAQEGSRQAYAEAAVSAEDSAAYWEPEYAGVPVIQPEEELQAQMKEAEVEEHLAQEMSRLSVDGYTDAASDDNGHTRILNNVRELKREAEGSDVEKTQVIQNIRDIQALKAEAALSRVDEKLRPRTHLMIPAATSEEGVEQAIEELKRLHQEQGSRNPVAKISGSKLNQKGLLRLADKLAGKDLVVEGAGDMDVRLLDELVQLVAYDETGINVVLIDTPARLDSLYDRHPSLSEHFKTAGEAEAPQEVAPEPVDDRPVRMVVPKRDYEPNYREEPYQEEEPEAEYPEDEEDYEDEDGYEEEEYAEEDEAYEDEDDISDDEEMNIDDFARYATQYASQIDCSITGKSMLALYERIEIMEEDNIPLTKANAEALIEEAADKAEKPSFGKMIKGVFSSKYDKDGLLILKEEHFI